MAESWTSLTLLEQIFACVAIPSTLVLVIQTILTLIGLGGSDADADAQIDIDTDVDTETDADTDVDAGADVTDVGGVHDLGLRVFTIRGLIAFLTLFGWTGLAVSRSGGNTFLSVTAALLAGIIAMLVIAVLLKLSLKLQHDGTLDYRNALGVSGTVYITVPPSRTEKGKVNVVVQGALMELEAVTDEETPIKYGTEIVVIGISGSNTLVVKRK